MSEAEEQVEVVVVAEIRKANDEASGGDGATENNQVLDAAENSQVHDTSENSQVHDAPEEEPKTIEVNCCTQPVDNLENGDKKISIHEDVMLEVIENSLEEPQPKDTAAGTKKIELEPWNRVKSYLFLFFIVLFFIWVAVYFAYDQGYISKLLKND